MRSRQPAIRFKLQQLQSLDNIYFPEVQAIPKAVTPNMEAILQGVARKVHERRLADIHNRPVYLLPHQIGNMLGPSKEEQEHAQRMTQHRWNSTLERRGRWPADPRRRNPAVRSLNEARLTKQRQREVEEQRARKKASWEAKYAESERQTQELLRETAMVRRCLGIT